MTRVLMTADTLGGVWTYAMTLAAGLCQRGIEVHLASMGRLPGQGQLQQAAAIDGLTLHPSEYRLCWMESPWADIDEAGAWLRGLAQRLAPDIVHLNDFGHADLRWPAPVLLVAHSCVLSWWQAVHGEAAPPAWQGYADLVARGSRQADCLVAPTSAMAQALQHHYGLLRRVHVVPNALPDHAWTSPSAKQPMILSAGRLWDEGKNVRALLTIAGDLPWRIVIAGEKPPAPLPAQAPKLSLTGPLEPRQLAELYASAAIFALPARYEPFGLAALEAAANGCALVLGDIPSLREVWGDAALYVPPGDPSALRENLLRLCHEPALRHALGTRARERSREFTRERMTSRYLDLYHGLEQRHSARARRTDHSRSTGCRSSFSITP